MKLELQMFGGAFISTRRIKSSRPLMQVTIRGFKKARLTFREGLRLLLQRPLHRRTIRY